MRLLWIRHGQTRENQLRQYIGHTDCPLNETGRQQVRGLRHRLKNVKIDRIYSSDLLRCLETAKELAGERQIPVISCSRLREMNFGLWEGKTYQEIMAEDPELGRAWYEDPFSVSPPGGETLYQLGNRVDQLLREILAGGKSGETVALVSHGGPIRWFQGKWVENNPLLFWQKRPPGHGDALLYTFADGKFIQEELPDME